jgi:uncharacterized protein YjbJ (UPF0337 family)
VDKDRIAGAAHRVKGAIKETVGKVTGDAKTQAEGAAEKATGKVQKCHRRSQRHRARSSKEITGRLRDSETATSRLGLSLYAWQAGREVRQDRLLTLAVLRRSRDARTARGQGRLPYQTLSVLVSHGAPSGNEPR